MDKVASNRKKSKQKQQPTRPCSVQSASGSPFCALMAVPNTSASNNEQNAANDNPYQEDLKSVSNNEQKAADDNPHQQGIKSSTDGGSSSSDIKRVLLEEETVKILGLESNYCTAILNSQEQANENIQEIHGLVNMSMISVQSLVKFLKSVADFQNLTVEVQTACLKAHMCSCLILMAVCAYDTGTDCVITQGKSIPMSFVKQAFSSFKEEAERLINLFKSMERKLIQKIPVRALLQLIVVFNPGGEDLVKRQHLSNIQDQYLILLKHYLESEYTFTENKKFYVHLLLQLQDIISLGSALVKSFQQLDPLRLHPLVMEVFNFEKKSKTSQ